ncbi:cytochrome c biogenesis CcdA family protein [Candidatus Chloroploca asiatica]|uniref:Cytochrome C biogenesis protein transmembrane domain-containing protein n=1 Tax=Candidatus Chloroploca asiatica TaxID=1506545 RepID=A0A2H3KK55_9CHLR|nr:cytochrome c biogenesis protein CcdA [Candidatus Chloroploca asiatica]PDV98293.1 hypothetical protein A9Q02_15950 [Candidatus Chloroploca asiatica]
MSLEHLALDGSLFTYVLIFLGGIVTSIGPCNLASIPLVMAYVGGGASVSRRRAFVLALSFAVGMAVTFMLLGVVAALVGGLMGGWRGWYYLLAGICFLIGLQLLGVINLPMPNWFGTLPSRITWRGLPGALALGLAFGLVASQCATPVLAAILTTVMVRPDGLTYGALLLFIYALGRGVPVVAAGTFAGALRQLRDLGSWSIRIEQLSGGVILGVGLYLLWIA